MNVAMVRWPKEAAEVERYRSLGVPRLLLLEAAGRPPVCTDPLEDWVRTPIAEIDLRARSDALLARAEASVPVLDSRGLLHFRGSCLALAAGEADVLRVLVRSFRAIVDRGDLARQVWPEGVAVQRNALDLRILRIRRRIEPLGLAVRTVWGRGYLLDHQR